MGEAMKYVRVLPGMTCVVLAILATVTAVWFIVVDRLPDGALAAGLAVALGTSGVMWILVERRRVVRCLAAAGGRSVAADQRDQPFLIETGIA